ncbi:MAG: hypothetical protein HZA88_20635 [Verrucomicrobia bacterium]|nr:hypothetical protein [Verrucomicrobiota bacterium]
MDKQTKKQVLAKLRERYSRAGREYKSKMLDQLQELFGFHRKVAIRAAGSTLKPPCSIPVFKVDAVSCGLGASSPKHAVFDAGSDLFSVSPL